MSFPTQAEALSLHERALQRGSVVSADGNAAARERTPVTPPSTPSSPMWTTLKAMTPGRRPFRLT